MKVTAFSDMCAHYYSNELPLPGEASARAFPPLFDLTVVEVS